MFPRQARDGSCPQSPRGRAPRALAVKAAGGKMTAMRVTGVDLFKADIPLKDPFRIAVMEMRAAANVFVRVRTDAGIAGWGEASPFWKLCGETQAIDVAAGVDLARIIKDCDPLAIDDRAA